MAHLFRVHVILLTLFLFSVPVVWTKTPALSRTLFFHLLLYLFTSFIILIIMIIIFNNRVANAAFSDPCVNTVKTFRVQAICSGNVSDLVKWQLINIICSSIMIKRLSNFCGITHFFSIPFYSFFIYSLYSLYSIYSLYALCSLLAWFAYLLLKRRGSVIDLIWF